MRRIKLSQGKTALIDDADYPLVSRYTWHAAKRRNKWYAYTKGGRLAMHQLLRPHARQVDHRNGNGLDNRGRNLRVATTSQNMANRGKQMNNTSGWKGVYLCKNTDRWRAGIHVNGRTRHLGRFDNILDAANAYTRAARLYFKQFAKGNSECQFNM